MRTTFDRFSEALRALCRQYHVVMAPTPEGQIGVWDVDEGDAAIEGLQDCTAGAADVDESIPDLPEFFITIFAAREFQGYVGHEPTQGQALALAALHSGSRIVPIGPPKHVRSWAVIKRQTNAE